MHWLIRNAMCGSIDIYELACISSDISDLRMTANVTNLSNRNSIPRSPSTFQQRQLYFINYWISDASWIRRRANVCRRTEKLIEITSTFDLRVWCCDCPDYLELVRWIEHLIHGLIHERGYDMAVLNEERKPVCEIARCAHALMSFCIKYNQIIRSHDWRHRQIV